MKNFLWFTKSYLRPHWKLLTFTFTLGIIVSVIPVASVQLIKPVLDDVFMAKNLDTLKLVALAVIALYFVGGLSKYFHFTFQRGIGELALMHMRNDLYSHIVRLPVKSHSKYHSGTLLTRVINDGQKIPEGIMLSFDFIREPITFAGFVITAFLASWKLTTMILLIAPMVIFVIAKVGVTVKRYTHRNLEQYGVLGAALNESFNGIRIIKAFAIEVLMKAKFLDINRKLYKVLYKTYRVEEISTPLVEFIGSLMIALVIYAGGVWVIGGTATQGEFMTVLVALGLAQGPIKKINSSNLKLQAALAAIERIREVLNIPMEKITKGLQLEKLSNSIKFEDVSFKYHDGETPALRNINLEVKKGEVVALVGSSGSGKTTLVSLLPRFFDISSGKITIDGLNIEELSLKSLRDNIALVSQDTFLFKDTVSANILCGKRTASSDDVIAAAKAAYAYDFIMKLPQGFDTMLGERGLRLSGGEKQRITIARAIIKNAPILVMDEATSALDSESENAIQKALGELMINKTTFVIAHRLSTIKNATRIIVLEHGKIAEHGNHAELISRAGAYKKFYEKQYGAVS
ncbi:MAG: ABC transporter ATP-binding protein [Pseudomonadota bacterium]